MTTCAVCGASNPDLTTRCKSCGSNLQERAKALNLFSTVFGLWKYPDYTIRKVVLAEHRNYTFVLATFEAIFLSFFCLFQIKAGDIYSIQLPKLLDTGLLFGVALFLPMIYLSSIVSYLLMRASRKGVPLGNFISGVVYGLHPLALGSVILLPMEIAVYGPYLLSNNPAPWIINAPPFYMFAFLNLVVAAAALSLIVRLAKLIFSKRIIAAVLVGVMLVSSVAATETAKQFLKNETAINAESK